MSDKNVQFEKSLVNQFENDDEDIHCRLKKGKHSLDSDEEDDDDKYDMMKEDDIEGQEESTIDFDDDIQITPFNMRDEMEEGHFDRDGTFIFNKNKDIQDHWIDNIDWVRIKESERQKAKKIIDARNEAQEAELPAVDKVSVFKDMLEILRPQESVAKALRRLGQSKGKPLSTAQRWKAKRQKMLTETEAVDKETMLRLTEMADLLLHDGMMEIYEATREKISFMLKQADQQVGKKSAVAESCKNDAVLDMFADDLDKEESEVTKSNSVNDRSVKGSSNSVSAMTEVSGESTTTEEQGSQVQWEYVVDSTETSPVLGPYSTTQMMTWKADGTFSSGVLCRRLGSKGQFYSSNRIDFELYI